MAVTAEQERHVSGFTLGRVFLRSLLLQAGFNTRVMQGLGVAFALMPALKQLYPPGPPREEAVRRHLALFNTHPYFASAILGALVRMEERIAAGDAAPQDAVGVRTAFGSPLAAIGDGFFWDALRPCCALLAALLAPFVGLWAVAIFLVSFNLVHLSVRFWLFRLGYRDAEGLIGPLRRAQFPLWTNRIRRGAAALAGGVAAVMLLRALGPGGTRVLALGPFVLIAAALLVGVGLAPRLPPLVLALAALAFGLLGSLFL